MKGRMKFKVWRGKEDNYNLDLNEECVLSDKSLEMVTNAIKDYLQIFHRNCKKE